MNQKPKWMNAAEWLDANHALNERNNAAARALALAEEARIHSEASKLVDDFMSHLKGGNDPWGSNATRDLGTAERLVLDAAAKELTALGFVTRIEHPTYSAPGGRNQPEETYTDEKTWKLSVERPRR